MLRPNAWAQRRVRLTKPHRRWHERGRATHETATHHDDRYPHVDLWMEDWAEGRYSERLNARAQRGRTAVAAVAEVSRGPGAAPRFPGTAAVRKPSRRAVAIQSRTVGSGRLNR